MLLRGAIRCGAERVANHLPEERGDCDVQPCETSVPVSHAGRFLESGDKPMAHLGSLGVQVASSIRCRRGDPRRKKAGLTPFVEALEGRLVLSTITVANLDDSGTGSLRAAINQANGDTAQDTIDFAPSVAGTITLKSALPDLSTAIILRGPGASALTVARSAAEGTPKFRIFTVDAGADVTISGLAITGGQVTNSDGGGIANSGMLTVIGSTFEKNATDGGYTTVGSGGGISNSGTLTITNSTFIGNSAGGTAGGGGGISNSGTLTVTGSTFEKNRARGHGIGGFGTGGGIYNTGTATVSGSTFEENSASSAGLHSGGGSGGGITSTGMLTITNSILSGNSARSAGGAIVNRGTLIVTNATLSGNLAEGVGGAIDNSGTLTITSSTLSGNSAVERVPDFGGLTGGRGGGIDNSGMLTISNTTISGNTTLPPSTDGQEEAIGGGIASAGMLTVTNSTFSGNSAARGGGVYADDFFTRASSIAVISTTIFANDAGGNLFIKAGIPFVSGGHNLFSDAPAATLDVTDLINTDPLLAPLGNYGGPTFTQALLPGSPAIDAGGTNAGVPNDQRGVARPQGLAPDIGAFESRGFTIALASGNRQSTQNGSPFAAPLAVTVASPFGEPVAGGRVEFTAPLTSPSATFANNPAVIDANGAAAVIATAHGIGAGYQVVAQARGASGSVAFSLANIAVIAVPPTVVSVQRFGVHAEPTKLVLTFSTPLNAASAQNINNYRIVTLGRSGRRGRRVGHDVRIRAASYDAASRTVTLYPAERLKLRNLYQLTVVGTAPSGVAGASGASLDGSGTGHPGSDFARTIKRGMLAGSSRAFFNRIRQRWATQAGVTEDTSAE